MSIFTLARRVLYVPQAVAGDQTVEITVLSLALTLNAPTVKPDVTVTPSALPLSLTLNAPTVVGDVAIDLTALSLSLTLNAPAVNTGIIVLPSALALSLTLNAPTVKPDIDVTLSALALTLTLNAPTVFTGIIVEPAALSMTLNLSQPSVLFDCLLSMTALALSLTLEDPSVSITGIAHITYRGISPDSDDDLILGASNARWKEGHFVGVSTEYFDVPETTPPSTPATNILRLYAESIKGFSFFKFIDDTGMVRALVRDSVIICKNIRGTTIAANRIVYATGSADNVPTVDLAKADSLTTMPAIGVTIESIENDAYGRVMQIGLLENINTNSLTEGDILYVSEATEGVPTITLPTTPNYVQEIGTVLVKSATVGAIQIVARSVRAMTAGDVWPLLDNTYYLGKNDDDTPFAWKGLILKDTTDGKYYRIEVINGVVTATDLTD